MRDRTRSKLDKLKLAVPEAEANTDEAHATQAGVGSLLQRESTLSKIAGGKQRTVQLLMHPPQRIRIWAEHNRNYELLSAEHCADLIEGFKRTGKQEFPAIVRRLEDDAQFDYELICGARRNWTATYLGWDLLIEVRDLNDRQAFILQDLENRDREDISDYERALDYKQALPKYFENSRAQMAQFLEIDKSNFSKLLDLADMPRQVVDAYADLRDFKAHHATTYKRLMAEPAAKRRVLDKARSLKGQGANGRQVFTDLKRAASSSRTVKLKAQKYGALTATPRADGAFQLAIAARSGDPAELEQVLRKDFDAFLRDYLATDG
jgi:ParB family chromosome partitioning protein